MSVELLSKELPPHVEELRFAAAELHSEAMRFALDKPPLPKNTTFAVGPNGETTFTYHHEGSNITTNILSVYGNDDGLTVVHTEQRPMELWSQSGIVSRRVTTYPLGEDYLPNQVVHTGRLDKEFNFTRESAEDPRYLADYDGNTAMGLCKDIRDILEISRTDPAAKKPRGIMRVLSAIGVKLS